MTPSAATLTAALPLTRSLTRSKRPGETNRFKPCSPTLRPIQKVTIAPVTEPSVARSAYNQNRSGSRAATTTIAKSMPSGRKKMRDESSAPIRTNPCGVRK